jgi:hypothetical protein
MKSLPITATKARPRADCDAPRIEITARIFRDKALCLHATRERRRKRFGKMGVTPHAVHASIGT